MTRPWSASPAPPGTEGARTAADGRAALSKRLTTALSSVVAPRLVPHAGRAFTKAGDSYTPAGGRAVVEGVAGTPRHAVVTVMRLR
ncbi:hypothetical protein AB0F03_36415 [Streptomyces sp. NPDC028722]|uniref:hypothetical protein n=1 Tax=Streptomyces sp. NPDC028722 TaxID=3155016 RepID=UPI0033E5598A